MKERYVFNWYLMKLHYITTDVAPYSFESIIDIIDDEIFMSLNLRKEVDDILNGEEVQDVLCDTDWDDLSSAIAQLFDMTTNGVFDWNVKTGEYYDHYDKMLHFLCCNLESESGRILKTYTCKLSDTRAFENGVHSFYLPNFYCGNGEPEGAKLALNLVDIFMKSNQWNIGFYDADGILISDIASWAKSNNDLDIESIIPVVWFGHINDLQECWSITPETSDQHIEGFWGDYYEGALEDICNSSSGLGIYYSVWEYGLDYDESVFSDIKKKCPICLDLSQKERSEALFKLVTSIYHNNKSLEKP